MQKLWITLLAHERKKRYDAYNMNSTNKRYKKPKSKTKEKNQIGM